MPARDTKPSDNAGTDGEPTESTSTTDASTTAGAAAAGVAPAPQPDPQRVIIEQAPAEPAVYYGDGGQVPGGSALDPDRPHVKADYQPFQW